MNDDLNIKFSPGGNNSGKNEKAEAEESSLDLVITNGGIKKAASPETQKESVAAEAEEAFAEEVSEEELYEEEYFEEEPSEDVSDDYIDEQLPAEQLPTEQLPAEQLPMEAEEEPAEEIYVEPPEIPRQQPSRAELMKLRSSVTRRFSEENSGESRHYDEEEVLPDPADTALKEIAFDSLKGKYDFLNLGIIAVLMIFVGMTMIFMKPESASSVEDGVKLTADSIKTGEYTQYLSEKYTENMPMPKVMAQANVVVSKLFGKSDLEFISFVSNEPPDGPVDVEQADNLALDDDPPATAATTTTVAEQTEPESITGKIPQSFKVSKVEDPEETGDSIFTGRPIRTTTSKETTTLDVPKGTEDTTTKKVSFYYQDQ